MLPLWRDWALRALLLGTLALAGPSPEADGSARVFGPRMDYDEWTPLGRGDPLKNDPTYDYVPPVLERVHYWMEPAKAKEANSRRDHVDPFLKFVDAPAGHLPGNGPGANSPKGYVPVQFANYRDNTLPDVPLTMLVPPPYQPPPQASTTPSVTSTTLDVEAVNMVHHSSTTLNWQDGQTQLATLAPAAYSSLNPFHHFEDSPVVANTFEGDKPVRFEEKPLVSKLHFEDKPVASNIIIGGFGLHEPPVKAAHRYPQDIDNAILSFTKTAAMNYTEPPSMKPSPAAALLPMKPPPMKMPTMRPPPMKPPPKEQNVISFEAFDSEGKPAPTPKDDTLASLIKSLLEGEATPSTPPPPVAPPSTPPTTVSTLTTDPLFSHYKQPATPVNGPPYLIIQGHSKVKTYGASKPTSIHGIPVHAHNDIRGDPS